MNVHNTGLYIERQHLSNSILYCLAREEFPGRGFSWGDIIAEKRGLVMFWGKCLNMFVTKNAPFYNVIVTKYIPGTLIPKHFVWKESSQGR